MYIVLLTCPIRNRVRITQTDVTSEYGVLIDQPTNTTNPLRVQCSFRVRIRNSIRSNCPRLSSAFECLGRLLVMRLATTVTPSPGVVIDRVQLPGNATDVHTICIDKK